MTPIVTILEPAMTHDLISLADCKILLGIDSSDVTGDPQLQMLISQNSEAIAWDCNRIFAKEKVEEIWQCIYPVCCPDGAYRIWLTHFPVKLDDIESVESPLGKPIFDYRIEELTGCLTIYEACVDEIIVTYTGGYVLPDDAPLPLQQVAGLMVRGFRTEAAAAATGGSGIRMLAHKESRVIYFSPKDLAGGSAGAQTGPTMQTTAIKNILSKFTRYNI